MPSCRGPTASAHLAHGLAVAHVDRGRGDRRFVAQVAIRSASISPTSTVAPWAAKRRAMAAPIPAPPR